jgi:HEPN domain-containing protein
MPPRTHVIADLMDLLPPELIIDMYSNLLEKIDGYYIGTRYPDAFLDFLPDGLPGKDEAEEAVKVAHAIFEKANQRIRASNT